MLSFSDPEKPPFPKEQVNKLIRKFLGSSYFSRDYKLGFARPHFQQRLRERRLIIADAQQILATGMCYAEPEYEPKSRGWRYVIKGKLISRQGKGTLVITFRSKAELQCVTIY